MSWVVVRISEPLTGDKVEVFGPHSTKQLAEASRRRIHLDRRLAHPEDQHSSFAPRTYIAEVRPEWEPK